MFEYIFINKADYIVYITTFIIWIKFRYKNEIITNEKQNLKPK